MPETQPGTEPGGRRSKRMLSPSQKYEFWLQLLGREVAIAEAATAQQVDRSTIMRIKQLAKEGALAARGVQARRQGREPDHELEQAEAEIARLSEACKELAVKLARPGWTRSSPRRASALPSTSDLSPAAAHVFHASARG